MALRIVASRPDPAIVTLPWSVPLEEWGDPYVLPLPARPVAARGPHRAAARPGLRGEGDGRGDRVPRVPAAPRPAAARPARRGPAGGGDRPGRRRRRGAAVGAAHRAPAVLAALPQPVQPRAQPRGAALAGRRARRPAGPAAPRRLLLGRRVAVQRAVPAQRRRLRGLPRRRGDRRAAAHPVRVDARVRPDHRHRERLRRAARPPGERVAQLRGRGPRHRRAPRDPLRARCGRS